MWLRFCVTVLLPPWHRGPQNLVHCHVHHSADQLGNDLLILPLSSRVLNSTQGGSNKLVLPDQRRSGRSRHGHALCTIFENGGTASIFSHFPPSLFCAVRTLSEPWGAFSGWQSRCKVCKIPVVKRISIHFPWNFWEKVKKLSNLLHTFQRN
jgi:hypothetical protein